MAERLQKFIARSGVASRRQAEVMIAAGRVKINGRLVTQPGVSVNEGDVIMVDGQPLKAPTTLVYYALNKPAGVITTSADEQGRQTVLDFVPRFPRVVACGRLDATSRGLVILTNDGETCHQITHPKFEHQKEYRVTATINKGPAIAERLEKLQTGILLDDGLTAPAQVYDIKRQAMKITFTIVLGEGRNRQIRRMCSAVGLDVLDLVRTKVGKLELGDLPAGKWRLIKRQDILD